ncbi:SCO family protein [Sphingomonas floccifaciens]|uniref:SCO family protein n=1 Tax=Sphingomonas floccifaciens TaxID=1844115 RepID=A0ABW4NEP4_9SPHN
MTRQPIVRLAALVLIILVAGLALTAVQRAKSSAPQAGRVGPLVGAAVGGPFRLIDQDGNTRGSESFKGRYRLMYFGYTYCPDICPTDVQKMSQGLRLFEARDPARAARVQPIMVTIDPERDTPAVMKQFVRAFHPRLIGLTGSPAEIKATLSRFAIYTSRQGPKGATDYLMDHSAMMYLMGPQGEPISFFARDATPEQIAADLAAYVA